MKQNYFFSKELIESEANNLYEMYERDFNSFQSSKLRAIAHCDREINIREESDRILWNEIKKELKDNF